MDQIYRTIRSNNNVISNQARQIDQLSAELKGLRLINTTSVWDAEPPPARSSPFKSLELQRYAAFDTTVPGF